MHGPAIAWCDYVTLETRGIPMEMAGGGYHVVVVRSIDEAAGTATIDDLRPTETIDLERLDARPRPDREGPQSRDVGRRDAPATPTLPAAVLAGLRATVDGLRNPRSSNFGLGAFERLADRFTSTGGRDSMAAVFPRGRRLWVALRSVYEYVEVYGTGGGLMRPMFARGLAAGGRRGRQRDWRRSRSATRPSGGSGAPLRTRPCRRRRRSSPRRGRCSTSAWPGSAPARRATRCGRSRDRLERLGDEADEGSRVRGRRRSSCCGPGRAAPGDRRRGAGSAGRARGRDRRLGRIGRAAGSGRPLPSGDEPSDQGRGPAAGGRARGPLAGAPRHGPRDRGPRLRLAVGRRAPPVPLAGASATRAVGSVGDARGAGGGHEPDRARAARRLHRVPQPGRAGEARRHDRRDQRRTVHPRPRGRLERDGVPGVRHPVRPSDRALRGGVHDHPRPAPRRRDRLRRRVLPGPRLRAAAARPASRAGRR